MKKSDTAKKTRKVPYGAPSLTPRLAVRYKSEEDLQLVQRAAEAEMMSINSWLLRVSLQAARRVLAKGE